MKKITLLLLLFGVSLGYSQVLVDFETPAYGTLDYSEENSGMTDDGVFSQLPNPVPTGNLSATAAEIITDVAGQPWQNAQLFLEAGDEIDLTGPTKTVSVLIYSTTATGILAKVVDGPGGIPTETAADAQHSGSGWETLTFDFNDPKDCGPCNPASEVYSRILFFPKWETTTPGWDCPFDGPCPVENIWVDDITNTGTLGVNDFKLASFKAYPNPSQDAWTIKTNNQTISSVQLFDLLGKQVLTVNPNSSEAIIDASGLSKGLYFARINTTNGINSIKLIKK